VLAKADHPRVQGRRAPELKHESSADALIRRSRSLRWFSLATISRLNQFQLVSRVSFA
jgi:hypothetical protein